MTSLAVASRILGTQVGDRGRWWSKLSLEMANWEIAQGQPAGAVTGSSKLAGEGWGKRAGPPACAESRPQVLRVGPAIHEHPQVTGLQGSLHYMLNGDVMTGPLEAKGME